MYQRNTNSGNFKRRHIILGKQSSSSSTMSNSGGSSGGLPPGIDPRAIMMIRMQMGMQMRIQDVAEEMIEMMMEEQQMSMMEARRMQIIYGIGIPCGGNGLPGGLPIIRMCAAIGGPRFPGPPIPGVPNPLGGMPNDPRFGSPLESEGCYPDSAGARTHNSSTELPSERPTSGGRRREPGMGPDVEYGEWEVEKVEETDK
ncbi:hypothetical protein EJ02DRAFT_101788 [Clathrospora elynae]|uniref:Uncharacterized protein n=1 Tax=Clathrospora elynae TaxID=706981 RepID=A0A6A5SCC9_9PLEO|nr:hypothetical protein EJ02DRAFT_101788 [Clathrospora elynae]